MLCVSFFFCIFKQKRVYNDVYVSFIIRKQALNGTRTLQTPCISGWLDKLQFLTVSILVGFWGSVPPTPQPCLSGSPMSPWLQQWGQWHSQNVPQPDYGRSPWKILWRGFRDLLTSQTKLSENNSFPRIGSGSFFYKILESKAFQLCGSVNTIQLCSCNTETAMVHM